MKSTDAYKLCAPALETPAFGFLSLEVSLIPRHSGTWEGFRAKTSQYVQYSLLDSSTCTATAAIIGLFEQLAFANYSQLYNLADCNAERSLAIQLLPEWEVLPYDFYFEGLLCDDMREDHLP